MKGWPRFSEALPTRRAGPRPDATSDNWATVYLALANAAGRARNRRLSKMRPWTISHRIRIRLVGPQHTLQQVQRATADAYRHAETWPLAGASGGGSGTRAKAVASA